MRHGDFLCNILSLPRTVCVLASTTKRCSCGDLFGTRNYTVDIGVVNAKMIWYVAVTASVVGHVLDVYIAHFMAIGVFRDRAQALRSQIPMLIFMVAYTMVSLWILSQPLVA